MTRRALPLKVKLASALLQTLRDDGTGKLVRVISHDEAKQMSADAVISRFHFDHDPIPHSQGGPDEAWNITPRPADEHRIKTAKVDIPSIAKVKRLTRAQQEYRARLLAKNAGEDQPKPRRAKRKIPSRPFQRRTTP